MNKSLESFQTLESYFEAFRSRLDECRAADAADTYVAADWQDNYARLARLRDRYREEKRHLNRAAQKALSKVFEEDTFIEGMMHIRAVLEHVTKRCDLAIRTTENASISLNPETSARAMFSATVVNLTDVNGRPFRLDHLEMLEEAERRIGAAMTRAAEGTATIAS
jgi:hypothetical protein